MLFGKPVVVTDTGCYSELPDDCVVKIDPKHEEALGGALAGLAQDRERTIVGHRAGGRAQCCGLAHLSAQGHPDCRALVGTMCHPHGADSHRCDRC